MLDTNQQDPDDTLTYSITAVDPTPPDLFTLNPETHELQLAAGMLLDRETTATYAYTVTVVDSVGMSDSGRIDITVCDVNDNAPTWDCDALEAAIATALTDQFADSTCGGITFYRYPGFSCNFRVHVPEIAGIDCLLIGDVALLSYVSDRDEANTDNSNIWLKVDHGDDEAIGLGLNPRMTMTPIDPNNGKLYIHERLDYFKKPFHTLTLRALDHGDPPMTGNVFFNVTLEACNRPPTCSSQNFTYCEETETRVGVVTAMDENDGALGALTYNITSGEWRHNILICTYVRTYVCMYVRMCMYVQYICVCTYIRTVIVLSLYCACLPFTFLFSSTTSFSHHFFHFAHFSVFLPHSTSPSTHCRSVTS